MSKIKAKQPNQNIYLKTSNKYRTLFFIFILISITCFTFSNIGKNQFVGWDDIVYVTGNKTLKLTTDNVLHSFFKGEPHGMYVPLTALSFSINHYFSGMKPATYLYTNLFLHLLTVIFCFIFIRKLIKNELITFFSTLLFAIHPAQAEVVAYTAGRRDVLYALFFMISLIFYLNYIQQNFKKKELIFSILFFTLSLLAKPQALLMPVILLAIDKINSRNLISKQVLFEKIIFIALCLLFGIISIIVKQSSEGFAISREAMEVPFYARIIYAFYVLILYSINYFIPYNLSLIHPYPANGIPIFAWLSPILVIAIIGWISIKFFKKHTVYNWGIIFYILTIALMLQIFPNSYGLLNDHYLYIPIIGISIFITSLLFEKIKNRTLPVVIFSIYALVFITISRQRVDVFKNGISVFSDVIKSYPQSHVAYNNRGSIYFDKNNFDLALKDFTESIKTNPENPYAYNNRAVIYLSFGKINEAMNDLNTAIKQRPDYADTYSNRGVAKGMMMDKTAIDDHNKAIMLQPNEGKYYYNRGAYFLQFGDKTSGCMDIQKAKKLGIQKSNPMIDEICNNH